MKYTRNYKTAQLYVQDSNSTFTTMMNSRFDAIRGVSNRRAPTIKRLPLTTTTKNPKHAQLLAECEIDYDHPLTPVEIAVKRAQRLAKEKQSQIVGFSRGSVRILWESRLLMIWFDLINRPALNSSYNVKEQWIRNRLSNRRLYSKRRYSNKMYRSSCSNRYKLQSPFINRSLYLRVISCSSQQPLLWILRSRILQIPPLLRLLFVIYCIDRWISWMCRSVFEKVLVCWRIEIGSDD